MLTIKNINKIVNHAITAEWYVEEIKEMHSYNPQTKQIQTLYLIIIRNRTTKYFEDVKLYRMYANGKYKRWYELSCIRKGNTHTQLITKDTIGDIKELLEHIKVVGID
jgi:hypothetical protein